MATTKIFLPAPPASYREAFASQVRTLVARIEAGDKEAQEKLIRLMEEVEEELGAEFVEEAVGGLLDRADSVIFQQEAEEKAEKAQQEAEQAESRKDPAVADKERRQKIAAIFCRKGFPDAAIAVEMELSTADGGTLAWIAKVLARDIPAAGLYGWAKFHAYKARNEAARRAREKAEKTTRELFLRFCRELRTAEQALSEVNGVPRGVWAKKARYARGAYERAVAIRFHGWALAAIERMMADKENPVVELLCRDVELAEAIGAVPERQRAVKFLEHLKERVRKPLEAFEQRIAQRREKSRMDSVRREKNRASRVGNGPIGLVGAKPGKPKTRFGPRTAGDPNRGGKRGKRK